MFSSSKRTSVEMVEDAYAEAFDLHAVFLPSARAGICWALRAVVDSETSVIGPAYTCRVVHEAMARSGGRLCLVDTEADTFLMDQASLASKTCDNCAVVLSEIYGYSYEPYSLDRDISVAPRLRIIDAAMTIPTPQVFKRLQGHDCVIFSFGIGKCLYAGFGGIVLTKDSALVGEIRKQRDARLRRETLMLMIMREAKIFCRTLAHARWLYGFLHKFRRPPSDLETFPSAWFGGEGASEEWYLPSTHLDRKLVVHNLERRTELYERRVALARRYHENLAGVAGIILPGLSPYAMSHYTIRVPSQFRDGVQAALWRLGIDTGTLFMCPSYLSPERYPNTSRISRQVLNLPLDASLTNDDVDYICGCIIHCASQIGSEKPHVS